MKNEFLYKLLKRLSRILFEKYDSRYPKPKLLSEEADVTIVKALRFIWKLDTDRYIDKEILENGVFELNSTNIIQEILEPGMIVADVGANFGYYSLQFGRLVGQNGYVYAFEPVDRYRARLLEHLKLNNITNVEAINKALSNKIGKAQIFVGECSGTFHWYAPKNPEEVQEVPLTTLDTFVEERRIKKLDFLKLDLDGHEPTFLEGAKNALTKLKPTMLIEFCQESLYAAGSAAWELADKLESLGYTLISTKNRRKFKNRQECLKEVANFSHSVNVLCIPLGKDISTVLKY